MQPVDIYYQKISATDENFVDTIERFFTEGGKGLNITVPFKEQAFQLADSLSNNAQTCGSVNTLTFSEDGRIHGESTDGTGLMKDLENNQISDLSPLAGLTNLNILFLKDNPIPEDQKAMLKKALPNCEILF